MRILIQREIVDETELRQMTVKSLFLDYDGTISPLHVSRAESKVPEKTCAVLMKISRQIPIVIVTTKDPSFVIPRTPFAHAWSTIGGLENKIGYKILETRVPRHSLQCISATLEYVKSQVKSVGIDIEEKRNSHGRTLAFSVDWRQAKDAEMAKHEADRIAAYCETLPLKLIKFEKQPFYDVYPVSVDKGKAVSAILEELKLKSGVMYLGDSEMDNPAFEVSDISLAVIHDETPIMVLASDYFVRFGEVPNLLNTLLENHLLFSSNYSMIKKNPWKKSKIE